MVYQQLKHPDMDLLYQGVSSLLRYVILNGVKDLQSIGFMPDSGDPSLRSG